MRKIITLVALFISSVCYGQCPEVSSEVEAMIKQHAESVRGGEYCRTRQVVKTESAEVVLYTIEGPCYKDEQSRPGSCGNHYFRNMTGIIDGKKYEKIVVGGKGSFLAKSLSIDEGVIVVEGLSYAKSDPMCCPSVSGVRKYQFDTGSFVEIEP
ncbi:hypothetical protein [Saccharophagus degradans]|uniref:Uncharacterized protein n=1 Tax=Saccharophagus degradans TaxID=86304 RepID=A0AAW7X865_9GAMM|nr:hypothetical protein [Saccharophagus degradans]MDO6423775.1 hypothetical protein [Saccharophagus degradans]MDO6607855.1 hypothetical protein [Saccharophagus degradans]